MISVSSGMSASTSRGEKYPSATEPSLHEDRMDLLRPVHAARERQLDVRGAAGSSDEIDHAPAPAFRRAVVPGFEEHAHLRQRFPQPAPIEHRDLTRRQ